MTGWVCCGCGCQYSYTEPKVAFGSEYCDMCFEDAKDNPPVIVKSVHPLFWNVLWFVLGFILCALLMQR
jgi:hypothetical protein